MKIYTNFEFKTEKKQIENEILSLKKSWENSLIETKEWNKKYEKYGEKKDLNSPYGILVSIEIYNKIREIYFCNIPFPHNTKELFDLKVKILKGKNEAEIMIVDKKTFDEIDKLAGENLI